MDVHRTIPSAHRNGTADAAIGARGLLLAVLLLMLGSGLLGTVIGLSAEVAGFSVRLTGFVMSGYYLGFLFGAVLVPRIVGSVGHIRVYAALASLASTAALVHALTVAPGVWWSMRVLAGFAMSGLYIVAEGWLNDLSTNQTRGRMLSIYMIVVMGGIALSQLLLFAVEPGNANAFIASSILVSLAVVPITLTAGPTPEIRRIPRLRLRQIWEVAPVGVVGGFGQGISSGATISLGAVYAARAGMPVGRIAIFMGLVLAGSVVFQWPIGALSDRMRRRMAISLVSLAAAGAALVSAAVDPLGPAALVAIFALGGLMFPLYSLALSHINDHVPAGSAVSVSAVYVFVAGVGAIMGPLVGSAAMSRFGPAGLLWMVATVNAAVGLFAAANLRSRGRPMLAEHPSHLIVPARAGEIIIQMARRTRNHGRVTRDK